MKKTLLFLLVVLLVHTTNATIWLVDNNSTYLITDVQVALNDSASVGDTIMVVGSSTSYGDLTINYPIVLIGEGINNLYGENTSFNKIEIFSSDVHVSGVSGSIRLNSSAGNTLSNITVERCFIEQPSGSSATLYFKGGNSSHGRFQKVSFKNNVFAVGYIYFNDPNGTSFCKVEMDTVTFENNIFSRTLFQRFVPLTNLLGLDKVYIKNNIFIGGVPVGAGPSTVFLSGANFSTNISDATVENNIFHSSNPQGCNNCFYTSNLTFNNGVNDTITSGTGNIIGNPDFFGYTSGQFNTNFTQDFNLNGGSPAIGTGTVGNIGTTGGYYPFLVGEGPKVPLVEFISIYNNPYQNPIFYLLFNCRARVNVYYDSLFTSNNDSVNLIKAEYWIDSIPIPNTGTMISLSYTDTISFNDSIPGLQLDTGAHVISVRVKDDNGNWGFIKTDTVIIKYWDVSINVRNKSFTRPGLKEKYEITISNNSNIAIYDLFLISKFHNCDSLKLGDESDSLAGIYVKNIPIEIDTNNEKIVPIWIYSLPANTTKTIDIYLTSGTANSHEIINNSFELWYNKTGELDNIFNSSGQVSDLNNSMVFYANYELPFSLDSTLLLNFLDSTFYDSLNSWYQNNIFPNQTIPLSHIIKSSLNGFGNFSDSIISNFAINTLNIISTKYFTIDDDSINLRLASNVICPPPCPVLPNCQSPAAPLPEISKLEVNAQYCAIRCRNGVNGDHKGWDFKPIRTNGEKFNGPNDTCEIFPFVWVNCRDYWEDCGFPVKAIYDGDVIEANYNKSSGFHVKIKSCVGTSDEFITEYNHLCSFYPSGNQPPSGTVNQGEAIGFVGTTGSSTGIHLDIKINKTNDGYQDPDCYLSGLSMTKNNSNQDYPCKPSPTCENGSSSRNSNQFFVTSSGTYESADGNNKILKECTYCKNFNSGDPNDKVGNKGYASPRYINPTDELHYGIFFENVDSATAPAQVVHITDLLDLTKVDASTFYLESITVGEMLIVLPDSVQIQNLDTTFMEEPINGCFVRAQVSFNSLTGMVDFLLTSLDTFPPYNPVSGAQEGFLPPDTTDFHGNGLVSFKVMPVSTIPDDTVIYNTAQIIFDSNPAIATGTWFNTIDRIEPVSNVIALPTISYDTSFVVNWIGTDDGAGIVAYDIYAKTSGDTAFTKWLSYTSLVTDTFQGVWDSTYQFYSIAYDSVGNMENKLALIESSTLLQDPVGINFIYNSSDLKIYPNPTTGKLTVEATLNKNGKLNVEIYNLLNQKLVSFDGDNSSNKYFKREIDVSNQADGVYFIHLKVDGQNITKKFILKKN